MDSGLAEEEKKRIYGEGTPAEISAPKEIVPAPNVNFTPEQIAQAVEGAKAMAAGTYPGQHPTPERKAAATPAATPAANATTAATPSTANTPDTATPATGTKPTVTAKPGAMTNDELMAGIQGISTERAQEISGKDPIEIQDKAYKDAIINAKAINFQEQQSFADTVNQYRQQLEELQKENETATQQEKTRNVFGAVTEFLGAFNNLYHVNRGATNVTTPQRSQDWMREADEQRERRKKKIDDIRERQRAAEEQLAALKSGQARNLEQMRLNRTMAKAEAEEKRRQQQQQAELKKLEIAQKSQEDAAKLAMEKYKTDVDAGIATQNNAVKVELAKLDIEAKQQLAQGGKPLTDEQKAILILSNLDNIDDTSEEDKNRLVAIRDGLMTGKFGGSNGLIETPDIKSALLVTSPKIKRLLQTGSTEEPEGQLQEGEQPSWWTDMAGGSSSSAGENNKPKYSIKQYSR